MEIDSATSARESFTCSRMSRAVTTPANRPVSFSTATASPNGEVSAESSAFRKVSDSGLKVAPRPMTRPGRCRSNQPTGRASPSTTRVGSSPPAGVSTSRTTFTLPSSSPSADRNDSERYPRSRPTKPSTKASCGFVQHLLRRTGLRQFATDAHDHHLIAELDGFVDVVGDQDDRLADLPLQTQEELVQFAADDRVDGGERLVHQQHERVGGQRPGDTDALLLTAGQLHRITVSELWIESDTVEQFERSFVSLVLGPAEQAGHGADVVQHGPMREQATALDDITHLAAQCGLALGLQRVAVPGDPAARRLEHPVDHPQRGRLAAARRSDDHGDLAGGNGDAQIDDCSPCHPGTSC